MINPFNNGDLGLYIRAKINAAFASINALPTNYIEKNGTTTPITGYLGFDPAVGSVMGSSSANGASGLYLSDNLAGLQYADFVSGRQAIVNLLGGDFYLYSQDFVDGDISIGSETFNQRVLITSTLSGFKGIEGDADYSASYSPLTYVQEKYVIPVSGTRSGNPLTNVVEYSKTDGTAVGSTDSFYIGSGDDIDLDNAVKGSRIYFEAPATGKRSRISVGGAVSSWDNRNGVSRTNITMNTNPAGNFMQFISNDGTYSTDIVINSLGSVDLNSTDSSFKGIVGNSDFSANYTANSFVQKTYTDATFPKFASVPGGELGGTYGAPSLSNSAVISKVLTGLNISGSNISATDTILGAFGKLQNQINGVLGGAIYQSTYNASINSPTLVDGTGTKGNYYVVSVAGVRNFGSGSIDFNVGDWVIYNGTIWQKVDNTDAVSSVNGFTGAVNLTSANVTEVTNLYFTNTRAIASTLSGYVSSPGTISSTDSILSAIQKLNGNMVANFIPYSGAASPVNLNSQNFTTTGGVGIGISAPTSGLSNFTVVKGTGRVDIGEYTSGRGAIWINQTTPSASNFVLTADLSGNTFFNGASTVRLTIAGSIYSSFSMTELDLGGGQASYNLSFGSTAGTKIGLTGQKMGFLGSTPVVKQTTAISASTFTSNTSAIANDTATFGGYTIGQVVAALKLYGLLT